MVARCYKCNSQRVSTWIIGIINMLFLASGIALVVFAFVGFASRDDVDKESVEMLDELKLDLIMKVIIYSGAVTVVAAVVGLVGACCKSDVMLKFYSMLTALVLIVQAGVGIWLYLLEGDSLRDVWFNDGVEARNRRIAFQDFLECCGFDSRLDSVGPYLYTPCPDPSTYLSACNPATTEYLDDTYDPIALGAISLAFIELVALVFSCIVICRNETEEFDITKDVGY